MNPLDLYVEHALQITSLMGIMTREHVAHIRVYSDTRLSFNVICEESTRQLIVSAAARIESVDTHEPSVLCSASSRSATSPGIWVRPRIW